MSQGVECFSLLLAFLLCTGDTSFLAVYNLLLLLLLLLCSLAGTVLPRLIQLPPQPSWTRAPLATLSLRARDAFPALAMERWGARGWRRTRTRSETAYISWSWGGMAFRPTGKRKGVVSRRDGAKTVEIETMHAQASWARGTGPAWRLER